MRTKNKENETSQSMLVDNYKSATLPTYGYALETYATKDYSMNSEEFIGAQYQKLEDAIGDVIATCDKYSVGDEVDAIVENQSDHIEALHLSEIAENNNQISRIRTAISERKETLDRNINEINERIKSLEEEIEPLKPLRAQFQIRIGRITVSVGIIITIIAMIVDAIMNYGFLQTIYLDNKFRLIVAAGCLCLMSDGSMFGLGLLLSRRKETFMPKPIYILSCVLLAGAFVLSIVGSIMIRLGSMPETFGTVTASGEYIGKTSYSMAEYGATMITALATTVTGLLSGIFSYDENSYLVSIRQRKENLLAKLRAAVNYMLEEYSILEKCDDPCVRDHEKRNAAEEQLKSLRVGLKLYSRKLMTILNGDPSFTERMALSGNKILEEKYEDKKISPIYSNKAC